MVYRFCSLGLCYSVEIDVISSAKQMLDKFRIGTNFLVIVSATFRYLYFLGTAHNPPLT